MSIVRLRLALHLPKAWAHLEQEFSDALEAAVPEVSVLIKADGEPFGFTLGHFSPGTDWGPGDVDFELYGARLHAAISNRKAVGQ